jgi:hypothetical protein
MQCNNELVHFKLDRCHGDYKPIKMKLILTKSILVTRKILWLEVLTVTLSSMQQAFWDVMCFWVGSSRCLEGMCRHSLTV